MFWEELMRVVVKKCDLLQGLVIPPGSKSQAIRALLFALLSPGVSKIANLPSGEDISSALNTCANFGAKMSLKDDVCEIDSRGFPLSVLDQKIFTGNSGICTHFILPLLGLRENNEVPIVMDCGNQMRNRPLADFFETLRSLGLKIDCISHNNTFPVEVRGELLGGKTSVSGLCSQYLSALLMALPLAKNDSEVLVKNLHERPYVELTLAWLKRMNIRVTHRREGVNEVFAIAGGQEYLACDTTVPGDFSSASYFIAAGVIFPGEIHVEGLDWNDAQGDKQLIDILKAMGAEIVCESSRIILKGGQRLQGIAIDAKEFPDLVPTLAVLGTVAQGQTEIYNVPQARSKETDRIHSMTEGLRKMGAIIHEKNDGMIVKESNLHGAFVKGYGDHRTVMALTIAGLLAEGETVIDEAESINKTYPNFFHEIQTLGGSLRYE